MALSELYYQSSLRNVWTVEEEKFGGVKVEVNAPRLSLSSGGGQTRDNASFKDNKENINRPIQKNGIFIEPSSSSGAEQHTAPPNDHSLASKMPALMPQLGVKRITEPQVGHSGYTRCNPG